MRWLRRLRKDLPLGLLILVFRHQGASPVKHPLSTLALATLTAIGLGLPAATFAQVEPPHRKPGLWEQSVALPGNNAMAMQMCIDEETEKQYSAMGKRPGCTQEF